MTSEPSRPTDVHTEQKVLVSDVRQMVADDLAAGYSPSATRRHVFVLRGVLDAAVEEGRIARNVAAAVKLPPDRSRPMRFPNRLRF